MALVVRGLFHKNKNTRKDVHPYVFFCVSKYVLTCLLISQSY
jgi:hypothetical protein